MKKSLSKPNGKENLTPRGWYNKWHAYLYGDALAKQGVKYKNVFLDDFEKMKKRSKIKKNMSGKITPLNVSTMQGDDKPTNSDTSNVIVVGDQVGMPEEKKKKKSKTIKGMDLLKKRISFADFRKQSQELNYGRDRI